MLLLDGANQLEKIIFVYIPVLKEAFVSTMVITVLFSFNNIFSLIFSITDGGPGDLTTTVDFMVYKEAFLSAGNPAKASAISIILLVIVVAILSVGLRFGCIKDEEV